MESIYFLMAESSLDGTPYRVSITGRSRDRGEMYRLAAAFSAQEGTHVWVCCEADVTDPMEVLGFWVARYLRYRPLDPRLSSFGVDTGSVWRSFDPHAITWLVRHGYARCRSYGPDTYGHTDLFLTDKGIETGKALLDSTRKETDAAA